MLHRGQSRLHRVSRINALLFAAACIVLVAGLAHGDPARVLIAEDSPPDPGSVTRQTGPPPAPLSESGQTGPPSLPSSLYGFATVNGADLPEGTTISAAIGETTFASTETTLYDGRAFYALDVPADDPGTEEVEGGAQGETVDLTVGPLRANQTAVWQGGTNRQLDLTASGPGRCPPAGDPQCRRLFVPLVSHGEAEVSP